jgi:DNA replication licensing factor MCM6
MPTSSMTSGLSSTANKVHFYVEQVKGMAEFKLATLYVDYQHLLDSHDLLARAITQQYYRYASTRGRTRPLSVQTTC